MKNGHGLIDATCIDCSGHEAAKKHGEVIALQLAVDVPHSEARRVAVIDDEGHEVVDTPIGEK